MSLPVAVLFLTFPELSRNPDDEGNDHMMLGVMNNHTKFTAENAELRRGSECNLCVSLRYIRMAHTARFTALSTALMEASSMLVSVPAPQMSLPVAVLIWMKASAAASVPLERLCSR